MTNNRVGIVAGHVRFMQQSLLVTGRRSKTNQVGETSDVRYLKNGPARAPPPRRERQRAAWSRSRRR